MQIQNPRSAKIAVIPLSLAFIGLYKQHQWRQFMAKEFSYLPARHLDAGQLVALVIGIALPAYFLWHAFFGRSIRVNGAHDSFMLGVVSLATAIWLTAVGLGYENHSLKLAAIAFFYCVSAFFFWWSYKGYPLGFAKDSK